MFRYLLTALGIAAALAVLAFVPVQFRKPQVIPDVLSVWLPVPADTVVLFTGYPGCSTVCPLALPAMSAAQKAAEKSDRSMAFLFVNIIPGFDAAALKAYTAALAHGVTAVQPSQEELVALTRALNLSHGPSPVFRNEYDHSGLIFILARQEGEWHLVRRIPASKQSATHVLNALHL